ncbi:NlpC/P60 family protein [Cognatishimia sp. F0-27]|uniref:NlpC/P60 family protein n=1 Tax=Cognatishimia sp. F0-27 TaxID=2816855 RepID=UPI001D0CAA3E|nr:C40 family peptidase [Cognatishimia sp. F0-27]
MTAQSHRVVAATRGWLGTPYHDQASLKGVGCDCLGLIRGVWRETIGPEPFAMPPYSRDWGEIAQREPILDLARTVMAEVPVDQRAPGTVLVFRMRAGALAKHLGILTEPARFIHAYERLGVLEEPLSAAWQRRLVAAFQFPEPTG